MTKPSKYYTETQNKLNSDNEIRVLDTIKEIKYTGKAEIIPLLFDVLDKTGSSRIKQEIISLFNQLKEQKCVPYIVEQLETRDNGNYLAQLVSSCWQSGLNYSDHLAMFARLVIKGDYSVALESFTVIEEAIHNASQDKITECIQTLEDNKHKINTEKLPLLKALIEMLKEI